jgi:nucleoside-diphosphate-sugar epimerase
MRITTLVRSRLSRGFTLASLGPNEARIFFDGATGAVGALVAVLFLRLVLDRPVDGLPAGAALPAIFIALNALAGLYTRLKLAASRVKAGWLVLSIAGSAGLARVLGAETAAVVLWSLLVAPPVVLARLFLGLPYSRQRAVASLIVRRHGPVLVVGGAGYIGCHTVERLLAQGHRVRVLDRLMYGREPIAPFLANRNFELVEGDVTSITSLTAAMRDTSAVVHLAGLVGDPACAVDPEFTRHTNIVATRMAKEVAQSLGVHRFVFASSCSVYGVSDAEVDESSPLNPVSIYAQTKIDSERELLFSVRDDFFVTILRFATVFGHSGRPRFDLVANLFTAQAFNDGVITVIGSQQWRPFVHVRDLARAIVCVLDASPVAVQSQIFNVGDRRLNMTIGQLAGTVRDVTSRYRPVEVVVHEQAAADRRNYAVSFEKIRSHLGFEAETTLEDGIAEMARNFAEGRYGPYRHAVYSNVEVTRRAVEEFYDPEEADRLYAPRKVG